MAKANVVDKFVGYFRPDLGLQRASNRSRMEVLRKVRSYEGASTGRNSASWRSTSKDTVSLLALEGQRLRDRCRDLERNNPLATKIIATHASNFVGAGIMPRAKTGDEKRNEEIDILFAQWAKECQVDGSADFYGLSTQLSRMLVTDGEVFLRKRPRRVSDGLTVPLQLQVLDSEFCDWSKNEVDQTAPVINGVEYDQIGRRKGYWMYSSNPLSRPIFSFWRNRSKFIPADQVIHVFEPKTNQVRGVPWLSSVIVDLNEVRDYEIAENIRKKTEACVVGVVIPEDGNDDPNVGIEQNGSENAHSGIVDSSGHTVDRMEAGMFAVARNGKDIRFNTPAISIGVEAYLRTRHRNISSGARIPYELVTGDYSQSNFASGKLGLMDYRRFVTAIQQQVLIHQCLSVIWDWFVEAGKLAGKIPLDLKVGVAWQPPEFEHLNRLDEAKADQLEVRMGKRSMPDVIAKTGRNPDEVLAETDEWNQKVDKTNSGVVLDSDPRRVSNSGLAQITSDGGRDGEN